MRVPDALAFLWLSTRPRAGADMGGTIIDRGSKAAVAVRMRDRPHSEWEWR